MLNNYKLATLMLLPLTLGSCTPSLSYKTDPANPASPTEPVLIFSLRNSNLLISVPVDKKDESDKQSSSVNACKTDIQGDPLSCLAKVTVTAVPSRDRSHMYSAEPNSGTTVTTTAVDTDPLLIKSVAVNYQNPASSIITGAGSGAVAGFAIGGPWGAAVGAGIGVLGTTLLPAGGAPEPIVKWHKKICPIDQMANKEKLGKLPSAQDGGIKLELPVVLEYLPNSISDCWHAFPSARLGRSDKETPLTGWFYRFRPPTQVPESLNGIPPIVIPSWNETEQDDLKSIKPPFVTASDYFKQAGSQTTFPISACRPIELQITWWQQLTIGDDVEAARYATMVADSNYVQPVNIPKKGNIFLFPICGGFASPTVSASPSSQLVDALIKQSQAVKEAQSKYNAANQSTKSK